MTNGPTDTVLLPSRDVRKVAPVSEMTRWRWIKDGKFPKPIKIARRNYWRSDEINAWLAEQTAMRAAA